MSFAQRTGKMLVGDGVCTYDTLVSRRIAPGAVYTEFQFNDIRVNYYPRTMRVHLITIDVTNPYNSFATYLANDTYYAQNKQSQEVAFEKSRGLKPVASMTGGAFWQSALPNATMEGNEMEGTVVSNGIIKYESSDSGRKFYMDNLAHIGNTKLVASVKCGEKSLPITQINHYRDRVTSQTLALFCNGIPKSKCAEDKQKLGVDVRVRLTDNINIKKGVTTCEVIAVLDGCEHSIGDKEAILSGTGGAETFLRGLNVGDNVTIDIDYVDELGESIDMQQQVMRFGSYGVKDGQIIPSSQTNYADCLLGVSQDGKTMYMADFENSPNSNAPVNCFLQFMQQIGSYNAMGLDGGPSAEMTIDGAFVTTNAVDGFEGRYIPGGLMLYSTAPTDNVIADFDCMNSLPKTIKVGEMYAPMLYGFNKYGEMINKDAKSSSDILIECSAEIGAIAGDGCTFVAATPGVGYVSITAKSSGKTLSVPITVVDNCRLIVSPDYVFTGNGRACQLDVSYYYNGKVSQVNPKEVKWSYYDNGTIASCDNGLIVPGNEGSGVVYAEYSGVSDTVAIYVENVNDGVDYIDLTRNLEYGDVENIHLPSVPYSFALDVKANADGVMTLEYKLGEQTYEVKSGTIKKDSTWHCVVELDRDAISTYPVTLVSITSTGRRYYCSKLIAYYTSMTDLKDKVVRIECVDDARVMLKEGTNYVPQIVAYNVEGEVVEVDITTSDKFEMSCTPEIGLIADDRHTFVAKCKGEGYIFVKIKENGFVLSIPVVVVDAPDICVSPKYLFTGEGRSCQVEVAFVNGGMEQAVDPNTIEWSTNDSKVVLSCENGYVVPGSSGLAEVYARCDGKCDTLLVHVENLIYPSYSVDLSGSISDGHVENVHVPSVPYSLKMHLTSMADGQIEVVYTLGFDTCRLVSPKMIQGEEWLCEVQFDRGAITTYPISIVSIGGSANPMCDSLRAYYAPKQKGDLDDDGKVTISDVNIVLSAYLNGDEDSVMDVDGDGVVSIGDVTEIVFLYLMQN